MKNYAILAFAVCCEVGGSLALKQAQTQSQPTWIVLTLVTDGIAFWLLAVLLRRGMTLSVAYGLWGAAGVALTALMGSLLFDEPFTVLMGCGIVLIIAGVLLVEMGADRGGRPPASTAGGPSSSRADEVERVAHGDAMKAGASVVKAPGGGAGSAAPRGGECVAQGDAGNAPEVAS